MIRVTMVMTMMMIRHRLIDLNSISLLITENSKSRSANELSDAQRDLDVCPVSRSLAHKIPLGNEAVAFFLLVLDRVVVVFLFLFEARHDLWLWFVGDENLCLLEAQIGELIVGPIVNLAALIVFVPVGHGDLSDLIAAPILVVQGRHEAEIRLRNFA